MRDVLGLYEVYWCITALISILVSDVATNGASKRETFAFTVIAASRLH